MRYDTLGIALTHKCTAECSICCVESSSIVNTKIDSVSLMRYLKDFDKLKSITTVSFSGGEAFLEFDELIYFLKYVKRCKKNATVITNGYWALSLEEAKNKLQILKNEGLDGITISYDEFHAKYVLYNHIRNVIQVCRQLKIPVTIQSVVLAESRNEEWINKLNNDLQGIEINFIPCYPVGNAEKYFNKTKFIRKEKKKGLFCRKNGAFSIDADGIIWPCCSPYITKTCLNLGNIYDGQVISDTMKRLKKHMILFMLRNKGFDYFLEIAEKELKLNIPENVISSCELCAILFCKEQIEKFIPYIQQTLKKRNYV